MNVPDPQLRSALLEGHYISEADLAAAESYAKSRDASMSEYLLSHELITKELIGQAVAEYLKVPYANLHAEKPSTELVKKIPEEIAKKLRVVLFAETPKTATVATDMPAEPTLRPELEKIFVGKRIMIAYAISDDIDTVLAQYKTSLEERFSKIIEGGGRVAPEILNQIFEDAFLERASDIHFEPGKEKAVIRFRIDGVLLPVGSISRERYENVLNRIKVESRLRIDEHFSAQDGSMRYVNERGAFDIRTSIAPTVEGEKVVLRLLASYVKDFSLGDLGLSSAMQKKVETASNKPFGMILVAGPTGSGKTTTLYSVLKLLNDPTVNITTIEDPVEYKVPGINQIQVNADTNLTFAMGLRSIVRQDPDIILVGEIRDNETAEIGVNAALTGHLLLSTFHANDASTAIPRLLDMEVEPFLLASTLEAVIGQRLVRKICEHCRVSADTAPATIAKKYPLAAPFFKGDKKITLYEGKGCDACGHTGYSGRSGIFEIISVTPEMENLILKHPSAQEVWHLAVEQGTESMFADGLEKVKNGITTIDELLRVVEPPRSS